MSKGAPGPLARLRHALRNPVPRFDSVKQLQIFLISAVVMILVIRTQLWLTNYPQLGGGSLHIAHLLWGGLFMLIAIWFALIYVNRWSRRVAAVLGGIGFGFFIDELGKFITEDNDYFFRPAAPLIYIIFIILFLVIREVSRRIEMSPNRALANLLDLLPSTVTGEFGPKEKAAAEDLLERSDQSDPRVEAARRYLDSVELAPEEPPSRFATRLARIGRWVTALTAKSWFEVATVTVLVIWALISVVGLFEVQYDFLGIEVTREKIPGTAGEVIDWGRGLSMTASIVLVGIGTWRMLRGHHQAAYRAYSSALLISIFITRVFSFLEIQFAAVFGLGADLLMLGAIAALAARDREGSRFVGGYGAVGVRTGGGEEATKA
ncbi:MAG: hypothetical protein ACO3CR_01105 [Solirubrobacterales bacterium]